MRDHEDRAALGVEVLEEPEDLGPRVRVEVARGLVREDDARVVDEGARDRRALALAARELRRPVVQPVAELDGLEELPAASLALLARDAPVEEGEVDVLEHGELRDEVEGLEDEAEVPVPDPGEAVVGEARDVLAREAVRPLGGVVEAAQDVEERRLPRARGADDRDEASLVEREVDPLEDVERARVGAVALVDALEGDDGHLPGSASALGS